LPASFDGKNKLSTNIDAKLKKLHLQTFRNYEIADLDLESDAVVLTGPNGAGKTNLLEAVSMLAPGRGLRRARREELGYLGDQQQTDTDCQIPAW
jgi:DNA replication and repair protein RecF